MKLRRVESRPDTVRSLRPRRCAANDEDRNGKPRIDWGDHNIDGVPGLMVMGEYEWWEDRITPAFEFMAKHPKTPLAFLADAGHGHFDYSDEMVFFLAMFIR